MKIAQVAPNAPNPIKGFLASLGSFIGTMTLACNRPIYAKEINLKQLLIEAYDSEKLKIVLVFVSRILKETKNSNIFKLHNPWLNNILSLIKDIKELYSAGIGI